MAAAALTAAALGGAALLEVGSNIFTSAKNVHEGRQNRRFQRDMSNTAHQREMADLRMAGLNPLLTGKYGGSSTPSGSQIRIDSPGRGITAAAQQGLALQQQIALNKSTINLNSAQAMKIQAETDNIRTTESRTKQITPLELKNLTQDLKVKSAAAAKANVEIKKLRLELKKLEVQNRLWDIGNRLLPKPQKIVDEIQKVKDKVKPMLKRKKQSTFNKFLPKFAQ